MFSDDSFGDYSSKKQEQYQREREERDAAEARAQAEREEDRRRAYEARQEEAARIQQAEREEARERARRAGRPSRAAPPPRGQHPPAARRRKGSLTGALGLLIAAGLALWFVAQVQAWEGNGQSIDKKTDEKKVFEKKAEPVPDPDPLLRENERLRAEAEAERERSARAARELAEQAARAEQQRQADARERARIEAERQRLEAELRQARQDDKVEPEPVPVVDPFAAELDALAAATALLEDKSFAGAEASFKKLEQRLEHSKDPRAPALRALAHYRLAESVHGRGLQLAAASPRDEEAARVLRQAAQLFGELEDTADQQTPREGSSLRAAALRWVVNIEARLYVAYRDMSKAYPEARTYYNQARRHRTAAEAGVKKLQQGFANATLPDGSKVVDVAIREVRELQ